MRDMPSRVHDAARVLVVDLETHVPDLVDGEQGFPKWPRHVPIVASMLSAVEYAPGRWEFEITTLRHDPAHPDAFISELEDAVCCHSSVVTANGRGFDVPVLGLLAMSLRRFDLPGISRLSRDGRFGTYHADVLDLFANHSAPKPSLSDLCRALEIPVKLEASGSDVASLLAAGDVAAIARYCETDVAATWLTWLHWCALRDRKPERLDEPLAAFANWVEVGGWEHLMPYAQCPAALTARQRAPGHAVQRMVQLARQRIEDEREASRSRATLRF